MHNNVACWNWWSAQLRRLAVALTLWLWLWRATCVLCFCATPCFAQHQYRGTGRVTYTVYSQGKREEVLRQSQFRFCFSTSNQCWQVRVELLGKSDFAYTEASCDGRNTYLTVKISEEGLARAPAKIDRTKNADVIGEVYPGDFPPPRFEPINPVWLAYCSGYYFQSRTDGTARPLWPYPRASMYVADYFVRMEFSMLATNPPCVRDCTQFCDGAEYGLTSDPVPRLEQILRYPSPYSTGFVKAKYKVTESTNVGSHVFAKRFDLEMFVPRKGGRSPEDLSLGCRYEGLLETLEYGVSDLTVGSGLKPLAAVVDYRTMVLKPAREKVQYQNPTDQWLPMVPGSLPYALYKATPNFPVPPVVGGQARSRRLVLAALALSVLLLPAGWFAAKLMHPRHRDLRRHN